MSNLIIECNICNKKYKVDDKFIGKNIKCPNCKENIHIDDSTSKRSMTIHQKT